MTATIGAQDFAWANRLRRQYFPPERNFLDAHVTLFHHLPPMQKAEIIDRVKALVATYRAPAATLSDVMNLGRGVAYRIESPDLMAIRDELAEGFFGLLIPQDQAKPRLHVTIQNKVQPSVSKPLFDQLLAEFSPRPFAITGLSLHHYLGGPWGAIGQWRFRGNARP